MRWRQVGSDADAVYDDTVAIQGDDIEPMVTWGTSPDQSIPINGHIPHLAGPDSSAMHDALAFMGLEPGGTVLGTRIDVAFIGSCTNGRLSDFEAVAEALDRGRFRVASHVRALLVPGSRRIGDQLIARGMDRVFREAGFEVRDAGCSLCCGMNSDSLRGRQVCASSSNRNFRGRQGSPTGRTILMSPVMVAAAAIRGEVADARCVFGSNGTRA
jgi:3-isopropylmalate/(R)-2-methylmalate dehydratase large subunit